MKKTVAVLTIFFYFVFCIYSVKYVYADWASPIVKQTVKSFVYNGLQYTVKITDTITSAKATTLAKAVANSSFSKVAIPLNWLGAIAAVASVGYLIYDLASQKQEMGTYFQSQVYNFSIAPYELYRNGASRLGSSPDNREVLRCGSRTYTVSVPSFTAGCGIKSGKWVLIRYYLWHDGSVFQPGNNGGIYAQTDACVYCYWGSGNCALNAVYTCVMPDGSKMKPSSDLGEDVVPQPSPQQIQDWVEANKTSFENLTPQLSPTKPQDAIEVSNTEYPDITAQVDSTPQASEESQPTPEEQPMPQPENPDTNYINPGLPDTPNFDSSFQVPEKKSFSDLLDRFFASIPFIGALRQTSISASGQCSFVVHTPFNTSGVMDFCQYDSVFSVIGGFIFAFASIYAIYIIFKRSD